MPAILINDAQSKELVQDLGGLMDTPVQTEVEAKIERDQALQDRQAERYHELLMLYQEIFIAPGLAPLAWKIRQAAELANQDPAEFFQEFMEHFDKVEAFCTDKEAKSFTVPEVDCLLMIGDECSYRMDKFYNSVIRKPRDQKTVKDHVKASMKPFAKPEEYVRNIVGRLSHTSA